jgi:RNA polymerase sigma-70 factor (ECF subfamily)
MTMRFTMKAPRIAGRDEGVYGGSGAGGWPIGRLATLGRVADDLAQRLAARDPDALQETYERYGRTTFGFLVKALRDRASAEDVQQQVFLEVWQRAGQYDPARAGLLTWIMLIARSRAVDHLRRRVPEPHDPAAPVMVAERVEPEVDSLVDHWHMAHLLRQLPHEEADLLRRRFYGGLSQREIASETGVPLGTVKMRMVSGLTRLRELMEAER